MDSRSAQEQLPQYRRMIRDQLLRNISNQINRQEQNARGWDANPQELKKLQNQQHHMIEKMHSHEPKQIMMEGHVSSGRINDGYGSDEDESVGGSMMLKIPMKKGIRKAMKKAHVIEEEEKSDPEEFEGGKFHFVKSMKHFGKELGTGLKKAGISEVSKEVAKAGVKFVKDNAGKLLTTVEEAAPILEEEAPLALMAAGMSKPKRSRQVSEKEKNRHALIRKLIKEHDCTLAEASKYIKENNIKY